MNESIRQFGGLHSDIQEGLLTRAPRSSLRGQESSQEEMTSSQSGVVELEGKRSEERVGYCFVL